MEKCEQAFLALKEHLGRLQLLSNAIEGENLYLYLTVSEEAVSVTLVREEENIQWPVYSKEGTLWGLAVRRPLRDLSKRDALPLKYKGRPPPRRPRWRFCL